MVGSDVASTNHDRPAGVADCLQCSDDGVSAPSSEISAVLKSEPTRAALSDDTDGFKVEARALPFDAFALGVGAADILAGRGADDDGRKSSKISEKSVCCKGADIVVNLHAWIVFGIERAPPGFDFARGDRREASSVHPEGPAPGGRAEQVEHLPHFRPSPCERDVGSYLDGQKSHDVKALRIAPNSPSHRFPCRQSAQVAPAGSFRSAA